MNGFQQYFADCEAVVEDLQDIGIAIRAARRDFGLTQKQLAELVELGERTVRDIERGSGSPGVGAVVRTAHALGLSLRVE